MPTNPVLTGPEAESWLLDHGLPWFVREVDDRIRQLVAPRRLAPVLLAFVVVAAGVHVVVLRFGDPAGALSAAVATLLLLLLGYAAGPLRLGVMSRWAARVAFRHVSLILPLALRALPMLLLFMTFLFINTEVWQVAGALTVPRLWAAVLVFSALGVSFLLSRLPDDVRRVEAAASATVGHPVDLGRPERANLILVLLVLQGLQVLLLAMTVFAFFVGFGMLAISDGVIAAWLGHAPSVQVWQRLGIPVPISGELAKVSLFLASFAALYFTIYAVSDPTYRSQFFTHIDAELEQAVGVRVTYRNTPPTPGGGSADGEADSAGHTSR